MNPVKILRRGISLVLLTVLLLLTGCSDAEDRLNSTVHDFADALSRGDAPAAAALTSDEPAAAETLGALFASLGKDVRFDVTGYPARGERGDVHVGSHVEVRTREAHRVDLHR